jgi:[ribosomal protein S5]-alanine N-acetyltransferase
MRPGKDPMPSNEIPAVATETVLETPRLSIEPLLSAHAVRLYAGLKDERLYEFIPQNPPASLQALEDRYQDLSSRRSPDNREAWLNWALRARRSGDYVGVLEATVHENLTAAIAYMVFVPFQGRGLAAEACSRLLAHLFEDYRVSVVAAEIDTRNVASIALVESLGFERVAFHKDADYFKGSSSDEYRYELGERCWAETRARSSGLDLPRC